MIDITGLDKAEVLAALWQSSKTQGMSFLGRTKSNFVDVEEARRLLEVQQSFDYLYGHVMKVDLSGDSFDPYLYDRDVGVGAAQDVIDRLRKSKEADNAEA